MAWDPKRQEWESEYLTIQRSPEYMNRVAQEIKEFGIDVRGKSVLDIGCGPGIYLHHLLGQEPARIVGFDISPHYMTNLRRLDPGALLSQGSAESLPFQDASFDFIVFLDTLLHLDAEKSLTEVQRVLRPGGILWISHKLPGYYWWKIRYRDNRPYKTYFIEMLSSIKRLLEPQLYLSSRSTYATRSQFIHMLEPLLVEKEKIIYGNSIPCQLAVMAKKPF